MLYFKRLLFVGLILLTAGHCTACKASGVGNRPDIGDEERYTSIDMIISSLNRGDIDYELAFLYKTYAIFDLEKLPERYRSDWPVKGATIILRDLKRHFNELNEEIREKVRPYLYPELKGENLGD